MSSRCRRWSGGFPAAEIGHTAAGKPPLERAVASAVLSGLFAVAARCVGALRQCGLQPLLLCIVTSAATAFAQDDCCVGLQEPPPESAKRILRVTADPNNLPFSNDKREGFENKLAELVAKELGAEIRYSWRAQRRGFFRETLKEDRADLVLGVPAHFEMALPTSPYYRSSYVFVSRKDRNLNIRSLDDPALRKLKIGVQLIGDDGADTPPAHALASRGIVDNIEGFTVYGDYVDANPPARIVDAVAKGDMDIAVVWGPLGGYFAKHAPVPLEVVPVSPAADPNLPFTFSIAMGVRKNDKALHDELDAFLQRKRAEIEAILDEYGVPRVPEPPKQIAEK